MNRFRFYLTLIKLAVTRQLEREYYYLPKLFKTFSNKGSTAVDIGANIGVYSYLMSSYFKQVHSFEPINEMYLRCSGLKENIQVRNIALSDEKCEKTIHVPIIGNRIIYGLSSLKNTFSESKKYRVNVDKLDNFTDIKSVDFIKIDTEGFEDKVIKGAQKIISRDRPVIMIEIEKRHNQESFQYISQNMYGLSYKGFYLNEKKLKDISSFSFDRYQTVTSAGECIQPYLNNFFFIPREKL